MKNNYKTQIFFFFVLCCTYSFVQSQEPLTQDHLFALIRSNHPLAKQAALLPEKGKQELLKAKGAFDPYVFTDLNQKYFGGKEYYSLYDLGAKIPTIYGADIKLGYDYSRGLSLNPENSTPNAGLLYGGFSVPLAQGLIIDNRRALLQKARIFAQATEVEQQRMLNELFFEAAEVYWQWTASANHIQILENAISLAEARLQMTRQSVRLGDRAAIDTVEARLQVQDRNFQLQQAQLTYQNLSYLLANFLWDEKENPMDITNLWKPLPIENVSNEAYLSPEELQNLYSNLTILHPDLRLYSYKVRDLHVDKRWKQEKLKPKFDLSYNFLNYANKSPLYLFPNQYKWGFAISMPIFLREAKGDLNLTKIKLLETNYQFEQKTLQLQNKMKAYENEFQNIQKQISLYQAIIENYTQLLRGEMKRFELGESSLFLVNAREVSLISAQMKQIELKTKYEKAQIALKWAAGILPYDN